MESSHFSLDAETKSIIEGSLNRFVNEAYEPTSRRARLNSLGADYRAYWRTLAELGVLGLPVREDFGGIGGSTQDMADALRVLARGLVLEPLIEGTVIPVAVLREGADAAVALTEVISGEVLTVLVGGRRGDDLRCSALADGYRLTGVARVVPGAAQADVWLIACVDDGGVQRVLRVMSREVDARVERYRMMDGREACDIEFRSTTVPMSGSWLEGEAAQTALTDAAAQAVSAYSAEAAGVMQSLVKITAEYLRTREQFGVPLSNFQALQHRFADMYIAALEARAISRAMARRIDEAGGEQAMWLRYAAPAVISRCAARVGHEAIQMHGGMGVTDELIVSHYNSRLVVLNKLLERWTVQPDAVMRALS
jgi:alkylation response protein AidB-like acyl-CoA dehydrogenase